MQETIEVAGAGKENQLSITSRVRSEAPTWLEGAAALASAFLLVLSFPNFDYHFLAWFGLTPLLVAVAQRPAPGRALLLGWGTGTLFFYFSCYWLTYSMIHYGELSPWLSYLLLFPATVIVGVFPGFFAFSVALAIKRWGKKALLFAPFIWATFEWARLGITGQLWNAIGYSQAEVTHGLLIQGARWGGVYEVGFLILSVNAAATFVIVKRTSRSIVVACAVIAGVACVIAAAAVVGTNAHSDPAPQLYVVAVQPNVPMAIVKTAAENKELIERHLLLSVNGLRSLPQDNVPRLVVWPESPMNFTYATDKSLQELAARFTQENHASLLLNSLEPAPNDGGYNSALLINEQGRMIAQYDKIRLMPFGEYVPLPQWLGGSLISAIVGDFTPGTRYTLMPVDSYRAGVFICIESAYPAIARRLTKEGADVLINISNDGYLGPTAVMRQHLANAIFRAVENGRPLLRVTNSGLSAWIRADGYIQDQTAGFQADVRTWRISVPISNSTFYTRHGDLFVQLCSLITIISVFGAVYRRRLRN